jgi:hypothetical protein
MAPESLFDPWFSARYLTFRPIPRIVLVVVLRSRFLIGYGSPIASRSSLGFLGTRRSQARLARRVDAAHRA